MKVLFMTNKFGVFTQKSFFLEIFFKTANQIYLKLYQKLETVALNHLMTVLCLG